MRILIISGYGVFGVSGVCGIGSSIGGSISSPLSGVSGRVGFWLTVPLAVYPPPLTPPLPPADSVRLRGMVS